MILVRLKVIGKFADCMKQSKNRKQYNKNDTMYLYKETTIEEYFENQSILLFEFYQ